MCFFLAVINKLIKEMVPNIRVSTDARDLLLNCCSGECFQTTLSSFHLLHLSEFIHLLASEASEVSEKQQKKVISPGQHPPPPPVSPCLPHTHSLFTCAHAEHVLEALATLGFPEYIDDVKAVHREYKEQASVSVH